jgi:hypothetical protein
MIVISHRGNIHGPNTERENCPAYIDEAINKNLQVEVDIRCINKQFSLGHDKADYFVDEEWILKRKTNIWFHCKNLEAYVSLQKLDSTIKTFCHSVDPYVITSEKYLWVHDTNLELNNMCIIPLINKEDILRYNKKDVYAVCTDYVDFFGETWINI